MGELVPLVSDDEWSLPVSWYPTDVLARYRHARATARHTATTRLRWQVRRMERHHDRLDQGDLGRLRAMRDELADRGVEW